MFSLRSNNVLQGVCNGELQFQLYADKPSLTLIASGTITPATDSYIIYSSGNHLICEYVSLYNHTGSDVTVQMVIGSTYISSPIVIPSKGYAIYAGDTIRIYDANGIAKTNAGGGGGGSGTVTSVAVSGGTTGLSVTGSPITSSGTITLGGVLAVANGGTGTTTPALVPGTNITITGTWPNQTINSSDGGGGSSPWTVSGSNIYYTTGKVGINTTTPQRYLHVLGTDFDGTYGGDIYVENNSAIGTAVTLKASGSGGATWSMLSTASGAGAGAGKWALYSNSAGYAFSFDATDYETMVAISNNTIGAGLRLKCTATGGGKWDIISTGAGASDGGGSLIFYDTTSSPVVRMLISNTGNVGIGTGSTLPTAKLQVNGSVAFTGLTTYTNDLAADADSTLPSGGLYKVTGSRIVFQKP